MATLSEAGRCNESFFTLKMTSFLHERRDDAEETDVAPKPMEFQPPPEPVRTSQTQPIRSAPRSPAMTLPIVHENGAGGNNAVLGGMCTGGSIPSGILTIGSGAGSGGGGDSITAGNFSGQGGGFGNQWCHGNGTAPSGNMQQSYGPPRRFTSPQFVPQQHMSHVPQVPSAPGKQSHVPQVPLVPGTQSVMPSPCSNQFRPCTDVPCHSGLGQFGLRGNFTHAFKPKPESTQRVCQDLFVPANFGTAMTGPTRGFAPQFGPSIPAAQLSYAGPPMTTQYVGCTAPPFAVPSDRTALSVQPHGGYYVWAPSTAAAWTPGPSWQQPGKPFPNVPPMTTPVAAKKPLSLPHSSTFCVEQSTAAKSLSATVTTMTPFSNVPYGQPVSQSRGQPVYRALESFYVASPQGHHMIC
eukprot:TRINITY_DN29393_c0_g1_i1.p1 TRINITY_DN29393_c0_g1~~TRINITY_DN29393_c0_g1_i1.p1  ORF type:complete len:409 (-),score=39.04 TRINITY_DN29393_c0_g1_i1:67-1293(-)